MQDRVALDAKNGKTNPTQIAAVRAKYQEFPSAVQQHAAQKTTLPDEIRATDHNYEELCWISPLTALAASFHDIGKFGLYFCNQSQPTFSRPFLGFADTFPGVAELTPSSSIQRRRRAHAP